MSEKLLKGFRISPVHLLHALLVFDKILQQMLLKMARDHWSGSLEPKPQIRE
jgi:hypothetical protein